MPVADLVYDGWRLEDPRPIAAAHPESFVLPSSEQQQGLCRGSLVKLMFVIDDPEEGPLTERMWCIVTGIQDDGQTMSVMLDNEPLSESTLCAGDILSAPRPYAVQIVNGEMTGTQAQAYLDHVRDECPAQRIW